MAKTKTLANAITRAQNEFKGITLANADSFDFANEINEIILKAKRWDFLLTQGTSFGTTIDTQDYANVPTDFGWLQHAWVQDDNSSLNRKIPLRVVFELRPATRRGRPQAIAVTRETQFRLFPVPDQTRSGSGPWLIGFEYGKRPTRLTATADTFQFDDKHFEVFSAGFVARVAEFLDMQQAGRWLGRDERGKFRGTGLWAKFAGLLNEMAGIDTRESDGIIVAPTESLYL